MAFQRSLLFNLGAHAYDLLTAQPLWREQIARVLGHVDGASSVIDLGCGPGVSSFVLAERLPHATVTGIDLATRMIERAHANHRASFAHLGDRVRFRVADATALPFDDGAFDLAVGHSFLYLVADRPAVLAEVVRVLRPGGALVLMEPSRDGSLLGAGLAALPSAPGKLRRGGTRFATSMGLWRLVSGRAGRMDPAGVKRLLDAAGFARVEIHPTLGGLGLHCVGRI